MEIGKIKQISVKNIQQEKRTKQLYFINFVEINVIQGIVRQQITEKR